MDLVDKVAENCGLKQPEKERLREYAHDLRTGKNGAIFKQIDKGLSETLSAAIKELQLRRIDEIKNQSR